MSKILRNVHESAKILHDAGLVNEVTMREFDALCLLQPPMLKENARSRNPGQA